MARSNRLYATNSAQWRRMRELVLSREPLCRTCAATGRTVPALHVDHVNGRADRREDYQPENLAPLCASCHSSKTNSQRAGRPMRGCDANGNPIDPTHHWGAKD